MENTLPPFAKIVNHIAGETSFGGFYLMYDESEKRSDQLNIRMLKELKKIVKAYSVEDFQQNPQWVNWKISVECKQSWEQANLLELAYVLEAPKTVFKALLERGFSPSVYNEHRRWTLMGKAVTDENIKVAELFMKAGFDSTLSLGRELCEEGEAICETILLDRYLLRSRNKTENPKTKAMLHLLWEAGHRPSENLPYSAPILDVLPPHSWVRQEMLSLKALEDKQTLEKQAPVQKATRRSPRL